MRGEKMRREERERGGKVEERERREGGGGREEGRRRREEGGRRERREGEGRAREGERREGEGGGRECLTICYYIFVNVFPVGIKFSHIVIYTKHRTSHLFLELLLILYVYTIHLPFTCSREVWFCNHHIHHNVCISAYVTCCVWSLKSLPRAYTHILHTLTYPTCTPSHTTGPVHLHP